MKKRKMVTAGLACLATLFLNVMPVRAQEWSQSLTVSSGFDNAWSNTRTFEFQVDPSVSHYVKMTYGYDKFFSKDYVKNVGGTPQGYYSKGKVTNSEGTSAETGWVSPGFQSGKVDVKHTGSATYTCYLKD